MTSPERAAQIVLTQGFINQDPSIIELFSRGEEITDNGGVVKTAGVSRGPQTFKVIPMTFDQRPTITAGGVERIIDYTLLGMPDAAVEVNDVWFFDTAPDDYFLVVAITDGHGWERKVLCERHLMRDGLQAVV